MGAKRKTDKHLPRRVYQKHGAYWYVDTANKWRRLGTDYTDALVELARILSNSTASGTMEILIAKYTAEELPKKALATQKGRLQEFKKVREVFGTMKPDDIMPSDVWSFYRDRGETEQAKHEVRALSAVLSFGRRFGACTKENPCFALSLSGGGPRDRYVTDEEYLIVRGLAPPMIAIAMDIALLAGFRKADVLKLERKHITDDGIENHTSKDKKYSLIEWNSDLRGVIDEALRIKPRVRQYVICRRDGQRYTADGFGAMWQRLMSKALKNGLKQRFTFHDIRAKSASDAGSDDEAAARLNHADAKITRRVYRRLPRRAPALKLTTDAGDKPAS